MTLRNRCVETQIETTFQIRFFTGFHVIFEWKLAECALRLVFVNLLSNHACFLSSNVTRIFTGSG